MRAEDIAPRVSRRTAVAGAGAGVVALAGGAACEQDGGGGGTEQETPTGDGGGGGTEQQTPPAGDGALARTDDIPVRGGKIFKDENVVVTQQRAGDFQGFSATCKHQGCQVSTVSGGTINCPCHGSEYNLDGSVANGPTTQPLDPQGIEVQGGKIFLAS